MCVSLPSSPSVLQSYCPTRIQCCHWCLCPDVSRWHRWLHHHCLWLLGLWSKVWFTESSAASHNSSFAQTSFILVVCVLFCLIHYFWLYSIWLYKKILRNTLQLLTSLHPSQKTKFLKLSWWWFWSNLVSQPVCQSIVLSEFLPVLLYTCLSAGTMVIDRALYLRKTVLGKLVFQVILVFGIHFWMFFILPTVTER